MNPNVHNFVIGWITLQVLTPDVQSKILQTALAIGIALVTSLLNKLFDKIFPPKVTK